MIRMADTSLSNSALDLTALIDIVFIVIAFLLLTASPHLLSLPVSVPETDAQMSASQSTPKIIEIVIQPQAPIWQINEQPYSQWQAFRQALLDQLAAAETESSTSSPDILIAADKQAAVEPLLKLMALLNEQQVSSAHIVMEQR